MLINKGSVIFHYNDFEHFLCAVTAIDCLSENVFTLFAQFAQFITSQLKLRSCVTDGQFEFLKSPVCDLDDIICIRIYTGWSVYGQRFVKFYTWNNYDV